jgi:hypothetical protein
MCVRPVLSTKCTLSLCAACTRRELLHKAAADVQRGAQAAHDIQFTTPQYEPLNKGTYGKNKIFGLWI